MKGENIALLEVIDRDGHVRQYLPIEAWPVRVGRALDNDLVVDDPHIAANHFSVDADEKGVFVQVGDTVNGLRADGRHRAAGERVDTGAHALRLDVGDSHLCLRLASHAVAPELPLHTPRTVWHSVWQPLLAGILVLSTLLFGTWLDSDPDELVRAVGSMLTTALMAGMVWCTGWSLLSKIFTRRSHFWWHVRVMLLAVLAIQVAETGTHFLAFALSWPWISDFAFVLFYAIAATMIYFHVLGVEPRRRSRLQAIAAGIFILAASLGLWFNHVRRDQLGDELYMSHLFPPKLRLARPVDSQTFVNGLAPLQARLDAKAKKRDSGADGGDNDED